MAEPRIAPKISNDAKKIIQAFEDAVVKKAKFPAAKASHYMYDEAKRNLIRFIFELEDATGLTDL